MVCPDSNNSFSGFIPTTNPTSLSVNEQRRNCAEVKWNSSRCWTLRLNRLLYSDRVANVFIPTALGSITSALVLKSGGKHPGIFFRPGFFIQMTENGRRELITIVITPVGPLK